MSPKDLLLHLVCCFILSLFVFINVFTFLQGTARSYESDRSSRDEKTRSGAGFSSTTATTPESVGNKTPIPEAGEDGERKTRKPIGGIAVLPPMEMKKIEEQRRSPYDRDRKSPIDRTTSPASIPEHADEVSH